MCTASDTCHEAGTCDPMTGLCSNPPAPDGTSCESIPGCASSGTCLAGTCMMAASEVDQSHFAYDGGLGIPPQQVIGQTFTVGKPGRLTGIELSLATCNFAPPAGAAYRVDLYKGADLLGSASLPASTFGTACAPPQLNPLTVGPGYYDFASACISVVAGDQLRFVIQKEGFPAGVCTMNMCTVGQIGIPCVGDKECEFVSQSAFANQKASYAGGSVTVNGVPSTSEDLDFKTFVAAP
jgi:hypothetical protein